jgi:hypothetical protein
MLELISSLFFSIGEVSEVHTVVDFYQYIKTVEYLLCVAFFIGFPMFFRHVINAGPKSAGTDHH